MLRRIWEIASMVCVINVVTLLALVMTLAAGGRLSRDKMGAIRDVMAGRQAAAAPQPTTAPAEESPALATAGQLIQREQTATQALQLQIDQQMRELKNFNLQLDQARAALEARRAQFEQDRNAWLAQRQSDQTAASNEGFKKSVAFYESIPADQAKDMLMAMDDQEVVRHLSAMDERKAARIAKAFQTDAEKARLKKVFDRMENPTALSGQLDKPQDADKAPPAAGQPVARKP